MTDLEHLMAKVIPEPNSGCWLWSAAVNRKTGYATLRWRRKLHYAHRYMYELHKGPIPVGLQIDHLCRVRCCVNPDHLEAVTSRENTLRGNSRIATKAYHAAVTHCPQGHPYNEANTIHSTTDGGRLPHRACRICQRNATRRWRQRQKEALV